MKETWKQRIRKKQIQREMQETGGMPQSAPFHRAAYHRHFKGYTEVRRAGDGGKTRIERIYTGSYYEPALTLLQQRQLRFVYLVFSIFGAALYLFCASRDVLCNKTAYVVIFEAVALVLLLWVIYLLCFYLPATGKMTEGDYHSLHKPLIHAGMLVSISMWITALASVLCFFLNREAASSADLLCALGFGVGGCFMFVLHFMEKRLIYRKTNAPVPEGIEDGIEIDD